jgi:hypothetical protein
MAATMSQSVGERLSEGAPANVAGFPALESLARAARQVALYGPEHPTAVRAIEDACHHWAQEAGGAVGEIRAEQQCLTWNGQPLPRDMGPVLRLHEVMRDGLIACIRFEAEVSCDDLVELLQLLARDPQEVFDSGGAMAVFGGAGGSIHVEDVDFSRELRESEAAWLETCDDVDGDAVDSLTRVFDHCLRTVRSLGDCRTLNRLRHDAAEPDGEGDSGAGDQRVSAAGDAVATQVAHAIQCAGEIALMADEEYWEGWLATVHSLLADLEPQWRAAIFRAPTAVTLGRSDMLTMIARRMSPAECVSLVLDYPGAVQSEPSRGLARVLARIMPDPDRKAAIESLLHAKAMKRGINEDIYRNVVGVLLSRSQKNPEEGAQRRRAWLPDAMAELTQTERGGSFDTEMDSLLKTTAPEAVRRARTEMLLELLRAELSTDQHGSILDLLADEVQRYAEPGKAGLALEILDGLRQAATRGGEKDAGRRAVAADALARTGTKAVVSAVVAELARSAKDRKGELLSLLGLLGDEGMSALVSLAREPGRVDVAEVVSAIAREDGASSFWLRRLLTEAGADAVPQIIRAVIGTGDARAMCQLALLAEHESVSAKLELIAAVRDAGAAGAAQALERLLYDDELSVRLGAVYALGVLKARETTPTLLDVLERQSSRGDGLRMREAIITALGEMGSEAAIPFLRETLLRGGLVSLFASRRPRIAAAGALSRISAAGAREALEQGAQSRSRAVRRACEKALAMSASQVSLPERGRNGR